MTFPRFYFPADLAANITLGLPDELTHHAVRVRRLRDGDAVVVFNGKGGEYPAILSVQGKKAFVTLAEHHPIERELHGHITLAQGLASGDKMDWVIEKSVELGVAELVPIAAQRSVLQLSGARLDKRMEHWQRLIASACEQCGRNTLMQLREPLPLEAYLRTTDNDAPALTVFCHPAGELTFAQALACAPTRLRFLVGPEGGWSPEEQAAVTRCGIPPVRMGERVLRTETAGLAMASAAAALLGWW